MSAQTTGGFDSLEAIQRANRDAGRYFFDPDTMRLFACRLSRAYGVRGVIGGRFFITTDRNHDGTARYATIRVADDDGAAIVDAGGFLRFDTAAQAHRALRHALSIGVRVEDCGPWACGVYVGSLAVGYTPHMRRHAARRLAAQIRRTSGAARIRCEHGYIDRSGDAARTVVIDPAPLRERERAGRQIAEGVKAVEVELIAEGDDGRAPRVRFHAPDVHDTFELEIPSTCVQVGWRETTTERRGVYHLPRRTPVARGRRA